ncbi:hypothetical protein [Haploplasma axanthum]|uniref:Uncharacterized protein n=1 Tax=Haploplasma axanthum TaxID=29552 RepID=A0A449BG88_HAPAX|nr:hypothetical protein [Haploplasma axanthum]VEU81310.1 Uncharacterised protein [Haploplasma axanthum]
MKRKIKTFLYTGILYIILAIIILVLIVSDKNSRTKTDNLVMGFSMVPLFVIIGIASLVQYFLKIKNRSILELVAKKGFRYTIISIVLLLSLGIIVSGVLLKNYFVIIIGVVYLLVLSGFIVLYKSLFRDDKNFNNKITKRYLGVLVGDEYYLNGVNILDNNNYEVIDKRIILSIDNREYESDEIIYVKGKTFKFLIAYKIVGDSEKIAFAVRHADFYKLRFNDIDTNANTDMKKNYEYIQAYYENNKEKYNDPTFYYDEESIYRIKPYEHEGIFFIIEEMLSSWPSFGYDDNKVSYWELLGVKQIDVKSFDEAVRFVEKHINDLKKNENKNSK